MKKQERFTAPQHNYYKNPVKDYIWQVEQYLKNYM